MNKYMLILFESDDVYTDMSPEDYQKEFELHAAWIQELGAKYESGEPLNQPAKTVRGREKLITDGPFIESKELVSGFYIIHASSLEEAAEISKGCPILRHNGYVEVREIMKM